MQLINNKQKLRINKKCTKVQLYKQKYIGQREKEGTEQLVSSDADSTRPSVDYLPYLQCIQDGLSGKGRNTNVFEAPKMI